MEKTKECKDLGKEWELVLEGTTIKGEHIHIYKNSQGFYDYNIEKPENTEGGLLI